MGTTKSAVARKLGISPQAIDKLIKQGKVKGVLADGTLDEDVAIATYHQNVRHYSNERKLNPEKMEGAHAGDSVIINKAVKEKYEALQVKADYEKNIGALVSAEEVARAIANKAREVRERLLTIADRLAPVLINISDENKIHEIIESEIESALQRLTAKEINE